MIVVSFDVGGVLAISVGSGGLGVSGNHISHLEVMTSAYRVRMPTSEQLTIHKKSGPATLRVLGALQIICHLEIEWRSLGLESTEELTCSSGALL